MKRRAIWPFVLAGLALAVVLMLAAESYRVHLAPEQPLLAVVFDHADHQATACALCHHNFVDNTGGGTCYNCHKYAADITADMETMFHNFCFGCHVNTRLEGEESGPMRECGGCHTPAANR